MADQFPNNVNDLFNILQNTSGIFSGNGEDFDRTVLPVRPRPTMRPPPRSPVNTTVLAAVLGSVAFVCISVIIVVWLIKREQRNRSQSNVSSASNELQRKKWNQASGLYETVGPVLPERPTAATTNLDANHAKPGDVFNINEERNESTYVMAETVNMAQNKKEITSDMKVLSAVVQLSEDEDAYLQPMKPEDKSESAFMDENNYLNLTYDGDSKQEKDTDNFDES